jgi:cardiolipin synthase
VAPFSTLSAPPSSAASLPASFQLLQGGQDYFPALIRALDAARRSVQLETYIFDLEGAGEQVAQALVRAARRGVLVQVLVDGVGTPDLRDPWQQQFSQAGVQWQVFLPMRGPWGRLKLLFAPGRWRRLHRKLCVVDEELLFCGGINVLDDMYDLNHGPLQAPRFDFTVQIAGEVARQAADAMALLWWRVQVGDSVRHQQLSQAWGALREAGQLARTGAGRLSLKRVALSDGQACATLVLRDNFRHRNSIERAYRKAIGQARQEVLISNAYFLPGGRLRRALVQAARRGVRVRLLLQGRYEYFMQYHAVRSVYQALLQAGVEIHEYETSFLHAKVAVVDGQWATVGSSNLDPLSLLLAREANVVLEDAEFAGQLRAKLLAAIVGHGRRVRTEDYARRPWRQRLLGSLAYGLMRLALFLTGHRY